MLFSSLEFLIFLPLVWGLYWVTPRSWHRGLLLIASYFFYMSWGPIYGLLLAGVSFTNWLAGRLISRDWHPRAVLTSAVVANLGVLAFYKYVQFLLENLSTLTSFVGWDTFS